MPFTLAHPAAVLPLLRGPFVPAALVAGTVAPDVPYFLRVTGMPVTAQSWYEPFLNATTSHTVLGLVTVDLPLALALYACYLIAARPMAALLPAPSAARTTPGRAGATTRIGWTALSLGLGSLTHVVWDSFTHGDGYVVRHVSLLSEPAIGDVTGARALGHLSSVVGLVVLAVVAWRRRDDVLGESGSPTNRRLGLALTVAAGCAALGAALAARRWWSGAGMGTWNAVEGVLSDAAKGAGAALGLAAIASVAAWWAHHAVTARRDRSTTSWTR